MQLPVAQADSVDTQHPSRRVRLWLAFGAGFIASALLSFANLFHPSRPLGSLFSLSFAATWLISTLLPLIMAVWAALGTAKYIRQDAYKQASQTGLSNWRLALILVQRVLDTHRNLLAFLFGLAPLWVVLALFPSGLSCSEDCYYFWLLGSPLNDAIVAIPVFINAVLLTLVAIWLGVWLGLRLQRPIVAAVGAFGLNSILAITLIRLDDLIIVFPADFAKPRPLPSVLVDVVGIYIVVPLIILAVITFLATQSARTVQQFSPLD